MVRADLATALPEHHVVPRAREPERAQGGGGGQVSARAAAAVGQVSGRAAAGVGQGGCGQVSGKPRRRRLRS